MANGKITLKYLSKDQDVAYISLAKLPKKKMVGIVVKQLRLADFCKNYKGPDIYFDFDKENNLIGMEILA